MQGSLSLLQTTRPAFPNSIPPSIQSSLPGFSLPAFAHAAFAQSAFVPSSPAPRPWLDPHEHMPKDLGTIPTMHFAQAQPWPASLSPLTSPAHVTSMDPFSGPISGTSCVDAAVPHSNGLLGHYASPYQQQPQSSSFDLAEWSYPASDSKLGASAAAAAGATYSGEEILSNVRESPFSQQQPANSLYRGCVALPSPSVRYMTRGNGETSLAQPEREQRARIWDVQHEEFGGSQGPELGLDDAIAGIGGDEALAAESVAELDHPWLADHIQNGFGAAESGSTCVFAAVQHAAIPICLPADIRTPCIILSIDCMNYQTLPSCTAN